MAITFDKALGPHPDAIRLRSERAEVLASNLANADTPGYKAKDIDFKAAMASARQAQRAGRSGSVNPAQMQRTDAAHLSVDRRMLGESGYRIPDQPDTGDGNTVDAQTERTLFMENALEYQASLQLLSGKISGLRKAIKGE